MGYARPRPKRLAEKLRHVRLALGLSQPEMHRRLRIGDAIPYTRISKYELNDNEPPLLTLLQYAHVAGVHVEALIDDEIELPEKLPGPVKYGEVKRQYKSRRKAKK